MLFNFFYYTGIIFWLVISIIPLLIIGQILCEAIKATVITSAQLVKAFRQKIPRKEWSSSPINVWKYNFLKTDLSIADVKKEVLNALGPVEISREKKF